MDRLQVAVCDDDQMYLEQIGEEIKTYTPQMEKQDAVLKNRAVIHYSCREEHREARMTGPLFPGVCLLSPGVCLLSPGVCFLSALSKPLAQAHHRSVYLFRPTSG